MQMIESAKVIPLMRLLLMNNKRADDICCYMQEIVDAHTVDAVPVVRCKDCDWYREEESICTNPHCSKSYYGCRVRQEHFCSYGERRDSDGN